MRAKRVIREPAGRHAAVPDTLFDGVDAPCVPPISTHKGCSALFDTLSDRLSGIFAKLRGKGRLTEADIDATAREIRLALLEADVALPVVRAFIFNLKERARGAEVSQARSLRLKMK